MNFVILGFSIRNSMHTLKWVWIPIHCFRWCFYSHYLKSLDQSICSENWGFTLLMYLHTVNALLLIWALKCFSKNRVWNNKVFDTIYVIHNYSSVGPESSKCFHPIEFRITTFNWNYVLVFTEMLFCWSESSVNRNPSDDSQPSTWIKQCVVWPIPLGIILFLNIALIVVLFPLEVLGMYKFI